MLITNSLFADYVGLTNQYQSDSPILLEVKTNAEFLYSLKILVLDTLIGVFSSTAVALGIFIATFGGKSFTKYNEYLIGDILSVTPSQIGMLALVLVLVVVWAIKTAVYTIV